MTPAERPTADTVLRISEAAAHIPIRRSDAIAFIRRACRVCNIAGRELVTWRDVLTALERGEQIPEVAPSATRQGLRRSDALRSR